MQFVPPVSSNSQPAPISSVASKLMARMDWKEGQGLGRSNQGHTSVLEESLQIGRAGLGYGSASASASDGYVVQRRPHPLPAEPPEIRDVESVEFCSCDDADVAINVEKLRQGDWSSHLKTKKLPDEPMQTAAVYEAHYEIDYDDYCQEDLVRQMWTAKSRFDTVPRQQFLPARNAANPYENLSKSIFINRAAVKMANLDALFQLTTPISSRQGHLTFADCCAGPGGFSEYMLWRRRGVATKGFGFTMEGSNDFRLERFHPLAPITNFSALYGADETGNIYKEENMLQVMEEIDRQTGGEGCDLVTADGGDSVEGAENRQEALMKQLILCQFTVALMFLKKNGYFLCKVFDIHTTFTAGLIYIMYLHFEKICLVKPLSSRPANSERYLVCLGLRQKRPAVIGHLLRVNAVLNAMDSERIDVIEVVQKSVMMADTNFLYYLKSHNIYLVEDQLVALKETLYYIEDPNRGLLDHSELVKHLLRQWQLPVPGEDYDNKPFVPLPQSSFTYGDVAADARNATWHTSASARAPEVLPPKAVKQQHLQAGKVNAQVNDGEGGETLTSGMLPPSHGGQEDSDDELQEEMNKSKNKNKSKESSGGREVEAKLQQLNPLMMRKAKTEQGEPLNSGASVPLKRSAPVSDKTGEGVKSPKRPKLSLKAQLAAAREKGEDE